MKPWSTLLAVSIFLCLLTACGAHRPKRDLIVLLPDPDGKVGIVTVTTKGGSQTLDKPGYGTEIEDLSKPPIPPKPVGENEITNVFGPALLAQPDPAARFISFLLYFEHDSAKLTNESQKMFPMILTTLKDRKPNEIYVVGHTDLVGTEAYNIELSARRANQVHDLLIFAGIKPSILIVSFYGKARPLVPTENQVSEPRNRRVEVIVR